ncbi:ankyrin [Hypoxylon argillaceum]|nr:ankyrin [Hypoxylon argillaceum]
MTERLLPEPGVRNMGSVHAKGITILYDPSSANLDICFVHGLSGHPQQSWTSNKRVLTPEILPEKSRKRWFFQKGNRPDASIDAPVSPEFIYWPRDLVPDVLPRARVFTFGYDTNISSSLWNTRSESNAKEHANSLLCALEDHRRQCISRPLIFVCQSLGGLVVQHALHLSESFKNTQPKRYHVYTSTKSLFFFGTPHSGANPVGGWLDFIAQKIKLAGFKTQKAIRGILKPNSEATDLLAQDFFKWTEGHNWSVYRFQENCTYAIWSGKIINENSSVINDPRHEKKVHMDTDHIGMCKFKGADDAEFRKVSSALLEVEESLRNNVITSDHNVDELPEHASRTRGGKLSSKQIRRILEKLDFSMINVRYLALKNAQRQTCKWLLEHDSYKSWIDSSQMKVHNGFFWIIGKPGTGKTILMKYLINSAYKSKNLMVLNFFFNARGTYLERSIEGMYRTLLWQVIAGLKATGIVSTTLSQLLTLDDTVSWPLEALKEALSSILMQIDRELYCFVDALDECSEDQFRDMIGFFEDLSERYILTHKTGIRVCFSSRHCPNATIKHGLKLILENEDGHSRDIRHFVRSQLTIDNKQQRQELADDIFKRSSKIFLWVELVVNILNKENDKHGDINIVRKRLDEIPEELHELFEDILTRDNENIEEMIRCIRWILFAKDPLRPEELYFALQIESNAGATGVWDEATVSIVQITCFSIDACKGLAGVTYSMPKRSSKRPIEPGLEMQLIEEQLRKSEMTVQFIHESVRDFLLGENGLQKLISSQKLQIGSIQDGQAHDILRDTCLKQITGNAAAQHLIQDNNWQHVPFMNYAIIHVLGHADSAQRLHSNQAKFLELFPTRAWVGLDNKRRGPNSPKIERHSEEIDLLYLLAELNLANLIRIYPQRKLSWKKPGPDSRFSSPLAAAMAFGNNEAVFELAVGALEDSSQLDQIKEELKSNMPRFKARISDPRWKQMDKLSLLCSLGSVSLITSLLGSILADMNVELPEALSNFQCNTSIDIYNYMFDKGMGVDEMNKSGETALMREVKADAQSTAEFLLEKGANPNITQKLHDHSKAKDFNCFDFVKSGSMAALLIRYGTCIGHEIDHVMKEPILDELVPALLKRRGADIMAFLRPLPQSNQSILLHAMETFKLPCAVDEASLNAPNDKGCTPLKNIASVVDGEIHLLEDLIQHFAPRSGAPDVVRLFLTKPEIDVNLQNSAGFSLLSIAVWRKKSDTVNQLLHHPKVDVNSQADYGLSPLFFAVDSGNLEIIQHLSSYEAVKDGKLKITHDSLSRNPLLWATKHATLEVVQLLIEDRRVCMGARCQDQKSVLDYA